MRTSRTLAIVAGVAAVLLGAVLWLGEFGSLRRSGPAPRPGPSADRPEIGELVPPVEADFYAQRSSVAAPPALDVAVAGRTLALPLNASVRGRVIDQDDVPVASARVSLYRGQVKAERETDAAGRFAFDGLGIGVYRLYVEGRSLPEGFLPPWRQEIPREVAGRPSGIFGTALRLTKDDDREVDLRVFAAGSVRGRLVGSGGEPIAGTVVFIRSTSGVTHAARTDAEGCFVLAKVYPGAYSTCVKLGPDHAVSAASAPLPLHFDLAPGELRVLADLVTSAGGHILRGSVVDETGQPVVGLGVMCQEAPDTGHASLWETVTDERGRYELGRVPSSALVVSVGPDESKRPQGSALISREVRPILVDTRGAPDVVDLGVSEVEATTLFTWWAAFESIRRGRRRTTSSNARRASKSAKAASPSRASRTPCA